MTNGYKNKKKYYLIIIGLIIFNLIIYNLFVKNGGYNMKGNYLPYDRSLALKSSLITFLISLPIFSFILGTVFAIIPYKKLSYAKKYIRSTTLTLLVMNALFSVLLFCLMILTFVGWYPVPQQEDIQTKKATQAQKIAEIKSFEAEMKILLDSSNYYFDEGIKALDNGENPSEITNRISEPLKRLEKEIDINTRSFSDIAFELQFTKKELDSVFKNFRTYMKPIGEKHRKLKQKGVKLN